MTCTLAVKIKNNNFNDFKYIVHSFTPYKDIIKHFHYSFE